jgi:2,3-bisphosphoglycerate-independent phosphoglycerate mutase
VWTGEDVGVVLGLRADRMRQLVAMLTRKALPSEVANDLLMDRQFPMLAFRDHCLASLTSCGDDLDVPLIVPSVRAEQTLGEVVAAAGLTQLRCAERIKATHVTRYFSGHRDEPFPGETRVLVPASLLIDDHEDQPAMRAGRVAKTVVEAIDGGGPDLVVVALANGDVLGHTGLLDAAVAAVEAVDQALGRIFEATRKAGGALFVVADHGNCELMAKPDGRPHHGHTRQRVPFIYASDADNARLRGRGTLEDVAPTILEVLGLERPELMSGRSLRLDAGATEG